MFENVIVGIGADHSRNRDAVALAKALSPGPMTLVCAYCVEPAAIELLGEAYYQGLRDQAVTLLERAREDMAVEATLLAVPDLSPARALQQVAAVRGAGLIVVGSAHHGRVGRVLTGDVGRGVLQAAPCPVAVAPTGFDQRRDELTAIAVGFDGSPESRAALDVAARWARPRALGVTAISAWDVPAVTYTGTSDTLEIGRLADALQQRVSQATEHAVASLPGSGVQVMRGTPAEVLAEADCDLLVLGSRGWGPARRVALGSTTDRLIHRAGCAIVVVPRPSEAAAEPEGSPAERSAAMSGG